MDSEKKKMAAKQIDDMAAMDQCDSEALVQHTRDCAHCRERLEDLRLKRLLRSMPTPEPGAYFERRLLKKVLQQARARSARTNTSTGQQAWAGWGWQLAATASLLLLVLSLTPKWISTFPAPQLAAQGGPPLQILLESPRPLSGATIRVILPANVTIEGYRNLHRLQWQVDIPAGGNRLSLPVKIGDGGAAGKILIEVEHGGARKTLSLPIAPAPAPRDTDSITTI
jgi:hypothetical protein